MNVVKFFLLFTFISITSSLAPLRKSGNSANGRYIVTLRDDVVVDRFLNALDSPLKVLRRYENVLNGFTAQLPDTAVEKLRMFEEVVFVEEDAVFSASQAGVPWGLDRIDQISLPLDGSYEPIGDGDAVNVYIIDSGIYPDHSDFEDRAEIAYNALPDDDGLDCNGHGSHAAGIVGGTTYGVAKATALKGVRVLDCNGDGYLSEILDGLDWVANNSMAPAVVAVSFSGGASDTLDAAIQEIVEMNIVVIAAAGNDIEDACSYSPGRSEHVITVAAVDETDSRAYFSNYGGCVDIFAPGVNIQSAWIGSADTTNTLSGTSVAAPHVAGAAAILLAENNDLTPAELKSALISRAVSGAVQNEGSGSPNKLLYVGLGDGPNTPPPSLACSEEITIDGTVITSPNFPSSYGNNEDCEHLISAPEGAIVTLTFDFFDIEDGSTCQYDTLEIYDYDSPMSSYKIGSYCGGDIPGPIASSGNHMYMKFTSDSDVTAGGFRATVTFQTWTGVCSCPDTCNTALREFTSPNYPSNYENNGYCTYLFTVGVGNTVNVTWLDFNLEPSSTGCYDSITAYDGSNDAAPLIGEFCGIQTPDPISSSGNNIYLVFDTDSSVTRSGFRATYGTGLPPAAGSNCTCQDTCHPDSSLFNSPNYPDNYEDEALCEYLFTVSPGLGVAITWIAFDLESGPLGACFDTITVYDGVDNTAPVIGRFCGTDLPDPVYSTGNAVYVVFDSDISETRSGFQARYESVRLTPPPMSTTEYPPGSSQYPPTTSATEPTGPGNPDCDNNYTDESINVTSPNYPSNYPRGSRCGNTIAAPLGQRVEFTFQTMDIELAENCQFDSVQLFNDVAQTGNITAPLCGTVAPPDPYYSSGNTMYVYFVSDFSIQGSGFSGTFRFV